MKTLLLLILSFSLCSDVLSQSSDRVPRLQEWVVPYENSRPRDPFPAPDGTIWFVGQRTGYVAVFNPSTKEFKKMDLPQGHSPHTVVVAKDGTPWIAGNSHGYLGKIDPKTMEMKQIKANDERLKDPHTIAFDKDGALWYTAQGSNLLGYYNPKTKVQQFVSVKTERSRPYGVLVSKIDGRVWANLFGTNKIAIISPRTMELTELELPRKEARSRRIAQTSDGTIWYVDYAANHIGKINPNTLAITEYAIPEALGTRPYAMAVDKRDMIWFVNTGESPNQIVGFNPKTAQFFGAQAIGSGGGAVRHMEYEPNTDTIWFGTDTNTLGRAQF